MYSLARDAKHFWRISIIRESSAVLKVKRCRLENRTAGYADELEFHLYEFAEFRVTQRVAAVTTMPSVLYGCIIGHINDVRCIKKFPV